MSGFVRRVPTRNIRGMQHGVPIGTILDLHSMVGGFIAEVVEAIPEGRMAEQPGLLVNHPAWTLSHLNAYTGVLLSLLGDGGAPEADAETERFGYGTTPVPDLAAYPGKRELLERFRARNARAGRVVGERHAEFFPRAAPERFQPFSPTIGHIALTLLVAHPPHHLGQLKQWCRGAGVAVPG